MRTAHHDWAIIPGTNKKTMFLRKGEGMFAPSPLEGEGWGEGE